MSNSLGSILRAVILIISRESKFQSFTAVIVMILMIKNEFFRQTPANYIQMKFVVIISSSIVVGAYYFAHQSFARNLVVYSPVGPTTYQCFTQTSP